MDAMDTGLTCPECRGPLQLADLGRICPICGLRMEDALDLKAIDMATGLIAADVVCAKCQYNLRTIPVGSVCPECGTPALRSLTRDVLRWANPDWVRRTAQGLGILAFAQAWHLAANIFSWLGPRLIAPLDTVIAWLISIVMAVLVIGAIGLGSFAITQREHPDARVSLFHRNQILRLCIVVMVVICALMWLYPFVRYAWDFGWTALAHSSLRTILESTRASPQLLYLAAWGVYMLASMAAVLWLTIVLRGLAVRAGRTGIRRALTVALGLWAIDGAANLVMMALLYEMYTGTGPNLAGSVYFSYQMSSCARQLASFSLALILLVACLRLRKRFRRVLAGRMEPLVQHRAERPAVPY